jgi:hypothetical protein
MTRNTLCQNILYHLLGLDTAVNSKWWCKAAGAATGVHCAALHAACAHWQIPVVCKVSDAVVHAAAAAGSSHTKLNHCEAVGCSAVETFWQPRLPRLGLDANPARFAGAGSGGSWCCAAHKVAPLRGPAGSTGDGLVHSFLQGAPHNAAEMFYKST